MSLRLASAAVAIPILALLIWAGPPLFSLFIAALAGVGAWEVCRLARNRDLRPVAPVAITWSIALVAVGHVLAEDWSPRDTTRAVVAIAATAYVFWQARRSRGRVGLANWRITAGAALYPGGLLAFAPLLRGLDQGIGWVFLLVLVTFVTDTSAYLVGGLAGKTPLAPSISPGKTREGAAGGLLGAVFASAVLASIMGLAASLLSALLLGLLMGVAGQLGDLAESRIKRWAEAKDSGRLIPGHGGVLDRLDSIVFNLVLVYYFVIWAVQ